MGELPKNLDQVQERAKDISFQSKTRFNTTRSARIEAMRSTLADVLVKLPARLRADPQVKKLEEASRRGRVSLIHLVNRHDTKSSDFKDYEFSRATVEELWKAGRGDARTVIERPDSCRIADLATACAYSISRFDASFGAPS